MKPNAHSDSAPAEATVWLPAEAFFVRRIPLDPAGAAAMQVELALETSAPFALEQLYYGYLTAGDGMSALIFATHRRLFPGAGWPEAVRVLPGFAALLGEPPTSLRVRLWQDAETLTIALWDGSGPLPAAVLARRTEPAVEAAVRAALLEEAARRLGGRLPEPEEYAGPVTVKPAPKGSGLELRLSGRAATRALVSQLEPVALEAMDVRDKAALAVRRRALRRDRLMWNGLVTALAGLALALVLEGALLGGGALLRRWRTEQTRVAEEVRKIETAQTLSVRIEEMAGRQLRPFEMLAVLNDVRPAAIQFMRCSTGGVNTLEIEGQTGNAASVGTYETALRSVAALESVEIRDVRLREGTTNFQLTAVFRPGALDQGEDES